MTTTSTAIQGASTNDEADYALVVENLRVYYGTPAGDVKAVDDVSFRIKQGERFALVGESGSGKSTLAMAIMRLTRPPGRIDSGHIYLNGKDLVELSVANLSIQRV